MTPNLLKYSNGWGHLLMSVVSMAAAVFLLTQHDPTLNGLAVGIITSVQGYWFISSSVNQVRQQQASTPPTPPSIGGNTTP